MLHEILQVLWFFVPAYLANMAPVFVQGHFEALATPMDARGSQDLRVRARSQGVLDLILRHVRDRYAL